MPYYLFEWNEVRLEKLELNNIDPDDFERIVKNPDSTTTSRSSGRPVAFGVDDNDDEIACIYELDKDSLVVSPITAYYTGKRKCVLTIITTINSESSLKRKPLVSHGFLFH